MKLDSSLFCQWQRTLSNFEVDQVQMCNAFNLLVEAYSSSDRYYHLKAEESNFISANVQIKVESVRLNG